MFVVMVSAHWDTVSTSPGVDDNGSGVAALLETARILVNRDREEPVLNTVIFAALDKEEVGCEGARALVRDFVVPVLVKQFGAAIKVCQSFTVFSYVYILYIYHVIGCV